MQHLVSYMYIHFNNTVIFIHYEKIKAIYALVVYTLYGGSYYENVAVSTSRLYIEVFFCPSNVLFLVVLVYDFYFNRGNNFNQLPTLVCY